MDLTMNCRRCDIAITAGDEDELVTRVRDHVRTHPGSPELTREHILNRLHRRQGKPAQRQP